MKAPIRLAVVLATCLVSPALAQVEFAVTVLGTDEESPPPTGVPAGAGGTAVWMFDDETSTLTYTLSVENLSGPPAVAHLHAGQPGVAGPIVVGLTAPGAATATVSASVILPNNAIVDLFNENLYVNVHTAQNPAGEVRGQVRPVKGSCTCKNASNHGQFVSCVKKAIKALDKAERKDDLILALKNVAPKSACGKKKAKVKSGKVACCAPGLPEHNIVTGRMCVVTSQQKCGSKFRGNVALNADGCNPNPCQPPASPAPAFLD
jgi:CHRD domain